MKTDQQVGHNYFIIKEWLQIQIHVYRSVRRQYITLCTVFVSMQIKLVISWKLAMH